MANELHFHEAVKVAVLNPDNPQQVRQVAGVGSPQWVALNAGTFANCVTTPTQLGTTGQYYANLPTGLSTARAYPLLVYASTATAFSDAASAAEYVPERQSIDARSVLGTGGTTYYVSLDGDDANEGLSPVTAKRHVASVLSAGSPLAGDGDLVLIGGGDFEEGEPIVYPEGVSVRGAGRGTTTVWVNCFDIDETYGHVIAGHRVRLSDFTMRSEGDGQANTTNGGNNIQIGATSTLVEGVVLERMHIYGESDILRGYFTDLLVKDCLMTGRWDGWVFDGACVGQLVDSTIALNDPKAPASSGINTAVAGSEIDLIRCVITASGTSQTTSAIKASAAVTYRIIDSTIDVSKANSASKSIENVGSAATILVANSSYDATKTTGTVTSLPTHTTRLSAETHTGATVPTVTDVTNGAGGATAQEVWEYGARTLSSGQVSVNVISPATAQHLDLYRADAYASAQGSGRKLTFTKAGTETHWPDTVSTVHLTIKPTAEAIAAGRATSSQKIEDKAGTVTSNSIVYFELLTTESDDLSSSAKPGDYVFWVVANAATSPATLRSGTVTVRKNAGA